MTKELKALIEDLRLNHEFCPKEIILQAADELERLAERTQQEPFEDLAPELFVVAQTSPADDGFSDTIDRIEKWLREHFSTPPQRKLLTDEEIKLIHFDLCNTVGSDYKTIARAIEAAHGIKE